MTNSTLPSSKENSTKLSQLTIRIPTGICWMRQESKNNKNNSMPKTAISWSLVKKISSSPVPSRTLGE